MNSRKFAAGTASLKILKIDGTWSGIGGIGIAVLRTEVGEPELTQVEPDLESVESGWKPV